MSQSSKNTEPESPEEALQLNRRAFLKAAALAAGALALPGKAMAVGGDGTAPAPAGERPAVVKTRLRLGVLLPERSLMPGMDEQFLAGMQMASQQAASAGYTVNLMPERVSPGGGNALEKGLALVQEERADLVVAMLNPQVAETLATALRKLGRILFVAEAGGDLPPARPAANLFYHTLNYWQSSLALGGWAAAKLGRRAAMLASLYESGFDAFYAFQTGFEAAAGQVVHTQVTHVSTPADWGQVLAAVAQAQPDFIYAQYSGQLAAEFAAAYQASGLNGRLPLAISSTLAADGGLAAPHCAAWLSGLPGTPNKVFGRAIQQRLGRPASAFAALGYEAVQAVAAALRLSAGRLDLNALQAAFEKLRFTSLRGAMSMDLRTHTLNSPLYLSGLTGKAPAPLAASPAAYQQALALQDGVRTGWLHAYYSM
jgi:branched-chain amino acid transport system substrate-binding protein